MLLDEDKGGESAVCCNWIEKGEGEERALMKR